MQVTRKLTIAQALPGSEVDDSMPVGWVRKFLTTVERATEGMQPSEVCIRGAANIYAEWQHTLSREEEVQARLEEAQAQIERIRAFLPLEGKPLAPDQVAELRKILG
jgi:hypothetical protein